MRLLNSRALRVALFGLLSLLVFATVVFATQPVFAATFFVGTCKAGAFGSINAAIAAVPSGSTINVCPGTYAEQVVISKALTLQGIDHPDH